MTNHAQAFPFTPARLATATFLLALAALVLLAPTSADGAVRVVAKVDKSDPSVRVLARTSRAVKRVVFLVDGERKGIQRSFRWPRGRKGVIELDALEPGSHRVTAVAYHRRGKVSRGVRRFLVRRKQQDQKNRRGGRALIKPARAVARPAQRPTAPSTAPSLPEGILFDGDFDNGYDGWHVQALGYRTSLFDTGAFRGSASRFEVQPGDIEPETNSERAEVSGATFYAGQDIYVRDTIRVGDSETDTEWQLVQQLREHDWCCSPGMAVHLDDDRELWVGAGDSSPMYWRGPELEANRWYDLVYRVKLSQDENEGFVEVWLDGVQQTMLNGEKRIYGETIQRERNYIKAGIYRAEDSTGTSIVDHDNILVGTSYEAVMAAG